MIYICGTKSSLYLSHSKETLALLGADILEAEVEEFNDGDLISIDFGGIWIGGMTHIEIPTSVGKYKFLAHHLTMLKSSLTAALANRNNKPYVAFQSWYFAHCLSVATAEELVAELDKNWDKYIAQEKANVDCYSLAMEAVAGYPGLDLGKKNKIDPKNHNVN